MDKVTTHILAAVMCLFAAVVPCSATKPAVTDDFTGSIGERWGSFGGNWISQKLAEIYDIDKQDIYRSPEEPSFLEWVGLWKQKDGSARVCFAQITGNPGLEPSYVPWYGNGSTREQWLQFIKEHHPMGIPSG